MRLTSKPSQYRIFYVEKVWNTTIILESESEQTLVTSLMKCDRKKKIGYIYKICGQNAKGVYYCAVYQ